MSRPPLVIRDGGLFTLLTCIVAVIIGAVGLIGPRLRSNAIEMAWGFQAAVLWYLLMLCAGLYGLYVAVSRRAPVVSYDEQERVRVHRLRRVLDRVVAPQPLRRTLALERIAMFGMGYALLAYPPAATAANGLPGLTASLPFLALSLFTGVRVRQIQVDLRKLNAMPANQPPADPPVLSDPEGGS